MLKSLYFANNLRQNIRNADEYRSNPVNYFHCEYQSSVNRIFVTFILMMFLGAAFSIYGITNTAVALLIAFMVPMSICFIILGVIIIGGEILKFMSGR